MEREESNELEGETGDLLACPCVVRRSQPHKGDSFRRGTIPPHALVQAKISARAASAYL
jgi:hypothetical protein